MDKGVFVSYRRGQRTQHNTQILIAIEGVNDRKGAASFIGRRVIWTSPQGTPLRGKIVGVHGNSGVVKSSFKKGLPGHAIGAELSIH